MAWSVSGPSARALPAWSGEKAADVPPKSSSAPATGVPPAASSDPAKVTPPDKRTADPVVKPRGATTASSLAAGKTLTVTYDVTPTGDSPRTANVIARVAYRNPDGTAANVLASLTVPIRPVAVTFRVLAPPGTPPDATLYLPGNIDLLGPWDPGKQAMTNRGNGIWEATITVLDGTDIQYKYTRGSWETVEDWGSIVGTNNRSVVVDGGITHTMVVDDTSTAWGSHGPDIHQAIQAARQRRGIVAVSAPSAASAP